MPNSVQTNDELQALLKASAAVKASIQKHVHRKQDWKDTIQLSLLSFRALLGIHTKGVHSLYL